MVKNLPANPGDAGDWSSVPGLRRSSGGGNGNWLQYSCLGNPMDRGDYRATVHGVVEGGTQLSTAHGRKQLLAGKFLQEARFV